MAFDRAGLGGENPKPRWNLRIPWPAQADERLVPTALWDLFTILLTFGDMSGRRRTQSQAVRQTSRTRMTAAVTEPNFWQRADVHAELDALVANLTTMSWTLSLVPISEGNHCSVRMIRDPLQGMQKDKSDSQSPVCVHVFIPSIDSICFMSRMAKENVAQFAVALPAGDENIDVWQQLADSIVELGSTTRPRWLVGSLNTIGGIFDTPLATQRMIHLLAAAAISLSLGCDYLDLPCNGIDYFNIPLTVSSWEKARYKQILKYRVTRCVSNIISMMLQRRFTIDNPLAGKTPAQATRALLHDVAGAARGLDALADILLGQPVYDEAMLLDQRLASLAALGASDESSGASIRKKILQTFITPLDISVRGYIEQLRELPSLHSSELKMRLQKLITDRKNWRHEPLEQMRTLIAQHANEMNAAMVEALRFHALHLVCSRVPAHSFLGQVVVPAEAASYRRPTLMQKGALWVVWFQEGSPVYLNSSLGIRYVHYLLRFPHESFSAVEIRAAVHSAPVYFDSAIEAIDAVALHSYIEQRDALQGTLQRDALQGTLQRADGIDENLRAEYEEEIQAIDAELRYSMGLGGRPRPRGDLERARRSVSNAIHRLFKKLGTVHPALRQYLYNNIHVGNYLSYRPQVDISWDTGGPAGE